MVHSRDDALRLARDVQLERKLMAVEDRLNRLTIWLTGLVFAVLFALAGVVIAIRGADGLRWSAYFMFLIAIAVVWWSYAISYMWEDPDSLV